MELQRSYSVALTEWRNSYFNAMINSKSRERSKQEPEEKKKFSVGKKMLLVFLAVIIVFGCAVAIAYSRYLYPTGEIIPGLYSIRTHRNGMPMGNFFLLQAGDKYVAIDAGADPAETENGLQRLGISANDVAAVFITHAHWDHIGSLGVFENAVVYAGNIKDGEFPETPHSVLEDEEIVEISDIVIQVFYTPGHTADSVCYMINGKYLFVGDLFVTTNEPPPPNPRRHSAELQLRYREEMLVMDGVESVFTGHFGLFRNVRFFRWLWL